MSKVPWLSVTPGRPILTSPNFLYLAESDGGKLGRYELATRLSYFLWSSMPDDELLEASLEKPEVMRKQVERMLRDSKAAAFVENFAGQCLCFEFTSFFFSISILF